MRGFLTQQASLVSILTWVLLIAFAFWRFKKIKTARVILVIGAVLFYLFSTAWLPRYLAYKLEKQYLPLTDVFTFKKKEKVYIHLLGSGYQTDTKLPATSRLCLVAQGRLTEAMRLYYALPNSVLVCSADGPPGEETQAMVAKAAVLLLGGERNRVIELNTPGTTKEEAQDLAKQVGPGAAVIVVTDAIHIPHAMKFFKEAGFEATAAPTNYKAINGSEGVPLKWWPSEENIYITNRVLHEYFASVKAAF